MELVNLLDSILTDKSIFFNDTVISTIKAHRTDRTEAIFFTAPKYLGKGGHNICGQTFLITMMKYLNSNYAYASIYII